MIIAKKSRCTKISIKYNKIKLRPVDAGISIPGDDGNLLPLPRVARNPPYITNDIIPDDGYVINYPNINRENSDQNRKLNLMLLI